MPSGDRWVALPAQELAGQGCRNCYQARMNVADYYLGLADQRARIMAECIADAPTFALHVVSHNFLKDCELMLGVITGPERAIFMQACRKYQSLS